RWMLQLATTNFPGSAEEWFAEGRSLPPGRTREGTSPVACLALRDLSATWRGDFCVWPLHRADLDGTPLIRQARAEVFGALRFMGDRALDATPERRRLMYDLVGWETAARPWEEIWIEEPQGRGRLHPDPAARGATSTGDQGRRDRDTL